MKKTCRIRVVFEYEARCSSGFDSPELIIESDLSELKEGIAKFIDDRWADKLLSLSATSADKSSLFSYSSVVGDNADLIEEVSKLYLKKGQRVADVTFGEGAFWKKVDLKKYKFFPSDLLTTPEALYDFRKLPYGNRSMNVVIFDPPYSHNPGQMMVNKTYKNKETTTGFYHWDILQLYRAGMKEAVRILKKNGFLWVKCKDEIESSSQKWSHREIYDIAIELGLYPKDLYILTQFSKPVIQFKQQHARKSHSYLWIFEKR